MPLGELYIIYITVYGIVFSKLNRHHVKPPFLALATTLTEAPRGYHETTRHANKSHSHHHVFVKERIKLAYRASTRKRDLLGFWCEETEKVFIIVVIINKDLGSVYGSRICPLEITSYMSLYVEDGFLIENYQAIQAVTFWSPIVGGHQQPLKGSPTNHPKKATLRIASFLWWQMGCCW